MEDWPIVVELLASHDDNLNKVELLAQVEIYSIEVPVFNGLRDVLPFNILTALRRMDYCFGKVRTIEHAVYLLVLTDYVSCAYNQRNFYRTFENALTAKFVDSLFHTLYTEWCEVFRGRPLIHFTDSELESIRKSLSRSVDRFPESFRHKYLLDHVVRLGHKYRKLLKNKNVENVAVDLPKIQRPLVSSENLLWKNKCKADSNSLANSGQKKRQTNMTKYVVKKPVHKEPTKYVAAVEKSTKNISLNKESTDNESKNVAVASQKAVRNLPAASCTDKKAEMPLEKPVNEDDSMDSVDVYLTRRSVYSPHARYTPASPQYGHIYSPTGSHACYTPASPQYGHIYSPTGSHACYTPASPQYGHIFSPTDSPNACYTPASPQYGPIYSPTDSPHARYTPASPQYGHNYSTTDSKSLSRMDSFFKDMKMMEQLDECALEVDDSDEEMLKVNRDSNYSELSVEEKPSTKWNALGTDDEKMSDVCYKPREMEMDENSVHSSLTISDEEKPSVNCDYVPQIVPDEEIICCDYLPKIATDEEKMNIVNNNSSPAVEDEVIPICDCCTTKTDHPSEPVLGVGAPKKKLNAFDILMRKVVPPKRKRFFK